MMDRRAALFACIALASCTGPDPGEALSGGDATVFDETRDAFSHPARNVTEERRDQFLVGNSFFTDAWTTAPGSVDSRDGLGPVFNANACAACHTRDGRGRPPESQDEEMLSSLVRISLPGTSEQGGPLPVPGYGDQIESRAIDGVPAEAATRVRWEEHDGTYGDGRRYSLRKPVLTIQDAAFGALPAETMTSMRVAPMVFGLGLLACVPDASIVEHADPDDADGDGISGRPNRVWDVAASATALGRFGWKANQPSIAQQNAGAFLGDMGLTTPLFPSGVCAEGQSACAGAITGGEPEVSAQIADLVTVYVELLAPPARRDVGAHDVMRGRDLFHDIGCANCHLSSLQTGECDAPELANQTIHPYTDLLLHDMGEGLADGRPDFEATGTEWRTPPLWGIGLIERVNDHDRLLHDGRARGFAEAILWHGGEAEAAREAFRTMPESDRDAVLAFLGSL